MSKMVDKIGDGQTRKADEKPAKGRPWFITLVSYLAMGIFLALTGFIGILIWLGTGILLIVCFVMGFLDPPVSWGKSSPKTDKDSRTKLPPGRLDDRTLRRASSGDGDNTSSARARRTDKNEPAANADTSGSDSGRD